MSSSDAATAATEPAPEGSIPLPGPEVKPEPVREPSTAVRTEPSPRRGRPILWGAVIIVSAFAGAAIARYVLPDLHGLPGQANSQVDAEISELRTQLRTANIDELRSRVTALESRSGAAADVNLTELGQRLAAAEQATADLQSTVSSLQQSAASGAPAGAPGDTAASVDTAATALSNQVADLSAHLNAMETTLKAADTALNDRLDTVEQRVPADLGAQIANLAAKSDLQSLDTRIASLEANTAAIDAKRAAAAIALADLARTADSGSPFKQELASVEVLEADPALLAPIAPYAEKGVRPKSDLIAAFDSAAREALRADRASNGNWWTRLWSNFSSMFLVRKTGPLQGKSSEAVLSRAGARAHAGDLKSALSELSGLQGPAAAAMADWRKEAQARVDLDQLITSLTGTLITALGPRSQP